MIKQLRLQPDLSGIIVEMKQKSSLTINHFGKPRERNYLCVIRIELITSIGVAQRN